VAKQDRKVILIRNPSNPLPLIIKKNKRKDKKKRKVDSQKKGERIYKI